MNKHQAPSSKLQRNSKLQIPNLGLELGIWSCSGAWCLVLGVSVLVAAVAGGSETNNAWLTADSGEEYSGGETTVFDTSPKAFGFPATNLKPEHRAAFFVGHSFFNENWVVAP